MSKHLTMRDRVIIQYEIEHNHHSTLRTVSERIKIDPSSLYREIQRNRSSCGSRSAKFNHSRPLDCHHLKRFPYVCNRCRHAPSCSKEIFKYDAAEANSKAQYIKEISRSKPKLNPKEMMELDQKVSYRLIQGQSIHHVSQTDDSLTVSASTLRRYVGKGYLSARNLDLAQTVQRKYKPPKESYFRNRINIELLVNRTYEDYLDYQASQPRVTLQLDLMIGRARDKQALLTLYEPQSKLQWGVIVNRSAHNVNQVITELLQLLEDQNRQFFDCILCDNGPEFQKLPLLEVSQWGELRTRIFYCDPYASYQKGGCERNHALVRRMIRKGESISLYSQITVDNIFSNLNSHKRPSLGNQSPFERFQQLFGFCITDILPLKMIPDKDIVLK